MVQLTLTVVGPAEIFLDKMHIIEFNKYHYCRWDATAHIETWVALKNVQNTPSNYPLESAWKIVGNCHRYAVRTFQDGYLTGVDLLITHAL